LKDIDEISGDVVDVALRLHRELGPGLLETVYETLLAGRLQQMGYDVLRQVPFRADLIVDGRLIVEVKSVERLSPVHGKQLLTYLRLMKQPVGLLLNFGGETLKEGVRRVVNNYRPSASPRLRVNNPTGE
jgi:iron complex transport system substrate-binding protein